VNGVSEDQKNAEDTKCISKEEKRGPELESSVKYQIM
jgi:hypothetical protein